MGRKRRDFVEEGVVEVGPRADHFLFLDGDFLGRVFTRYSGVEPKVGEYTRLGKARITVEWLEDGEATEEPFPPSNG